MGEKADADADLREDEPDAQSGSSGEVDEPTAESAPESDEPDRERSGTDESDTQSEEPSVSPSETTAEDGGTPSSEPPTVESDHENEDTEANDEEDSEQDDENQDGEETDEKADVDDDSGGNLQPVERPDVSLDPDQLDPDDPPGNLERRERTSELERPDVHKPPEERTPPEEAEGSAPLAQDVATGVEETDSSATFEEVAERDQPLEDEEMPLADHIEEMLKRLAIVIVIAGVVSLAVLPFAETAINFLWNSVLPAGETTRPRIYAPLALVLTKLKVASLAGIVIALPVFVYETYLFMRPGLYPHERRYYLAAVPTSLVLAFVGISFAYFLILPVIFEYFLYYSEDVTTIAFALTKTFNLILLLMGYLAIVFQIPLFIMLAIMMGLTTRRWLVERRLYFWGAFLGIAFLFSPDPTGMAPIMVATTMVGLFEGTLFLLKWTGR